MDTLTAVPAPLGLGCDQSATIRQAWWRLGPHEGDNRVAQLAPGTLVEVDSIHIGETVAGDDQWLHLVDERGFVHCSALERA